MSNARSPRLVCSITIGTRALIVCHPSVIYMRQSSLDSEPPPLDGLSRLGALAAVQHLLVRRAGLFACGLLARRSPARGRRLFLPAGLFVIVVVNVAVPLGGDLLHLDLGVSHQE